MPGSPGRDLLLLSALMLAGLLLGNVSGNAGAGLAGGVLVYLLISYRRMAKLQHWLADGPLEREDASEVLRLFRAAGAGRHAR